MNLQDNGVEDTKIHFKKLKISAAAELATVLESKGLIRNCS